MLHTQTFDDEFCLTHLLLSFLKGTHSAPVEGENNVLRARELPLERRRVPHLLSMEVLRRSKLWGKFIPHNPYEFLYRVV